MNDYQHNATVAYTSRDLCGNRRENVLHLIGTADEIAHSISEMVKHGLDNGNGPYTFTPVHPANVINLTDRA